MAKGSSPVDPGRGLAFNAGSRPFYFGELETGVAKLKQRYFTEAVAAANQRFEFSDTVVLDADYEIEFKTMMPTNLPASSQGLINGLNGFTLYNNTSGGFNTQYPITDGSKDYNVGIRPSDMATLAGKLVTGILKRVGNIITLTMGSFTDSHTRTDWDKIEITAVLGAVGGGLQFDGIIADLKVWKGGDRNTGTLVVDCPIDEDSDIAENKAATLGPELWKWNGKVTAGSQWANLFVDNKRAFSNDAGVERPVLVEIKMINAPAGGAVQVRLGDNIQIGVTRDNPVVTKIVTPVGTRLSAVESSPSGTVIGATLEVSVKEIPAETPYLVGKNFTSASRTRYTWDDVLKEWLGPNVVKNGQFNENANDWVLQGSWQYLDGKVTRATPMEDLRDLYQENILNIGDTYRVNVEISNHGQGDLKIWNKTSSVFVGGADGKYSVKMKALFDRLVLFAERPPPFVGSVDNIEARKILEVV